MVLDLDLLHLPSIGSVSLCHRLIPITKYCLFHALGRNRLMIIICLVIEKFKGTFAVLTVEVRFG